MVSTTYDQQRGERHTDTRTDTTVAYRNSVEFRCTSFEVLQHENPGIVRWFPPLFPRDFKNFGESYLK